MEISKILDFNSALTEILAYSSPYTYIHETYFLLFCINFIISTDQADSSIINMFPCVFSYKMA
jgi:hypothetical protein